MKNELKSLIWGGLTFIPFLGKILDRGTGGTISARYCYSVWLRHMVMAHASGLNTFPRVIAELGPGDSLGIGLAALICGSEEYYALDAVEHANSSRNLEIFDELVILFRNKTPIPDEDEFPEVKPKLSSYAFPTDILSEERMHFVLSASRLLKIRKSLQTPQSTLSVIHYRAPWDSADAIGGESIDLIYSQAVLEHVDDLSGAYRNMHAWLKPGGYLSHQIDFKCHGTADEWNGHWKYSDLMWRLIRGKRPYLINREPHSVHVKYLNSEGFQILCDLKVVSESQFHSSQLAPRFKSMSNSDLTVSGAFIQAIKRNPA